MTYTHQAIVSADAPPRPACGGVGRSVMRKADVDCPDCVQLEADRRSRTAEPDTVSPVVPLMTQDEVADAFRVGPRQPNRWAKAGLIGRVMTPGGKPRYRRDEIEALLTRGTRTPPFLKRTTEQR